MRQGLRGIADPAAKPLRGLILGAGARPPGRGQRIGRGAFARLLYLPHPCCLPKKSQWNILGIMATLRSRVYLSGTEGSSEASGLVREPGSPIDAGPLETKRRDGPAAGLPGWLCRAGGRDDVLQNVWPLLRTETPMSTRPFRFVHASDLHLEQPLMGLTEVPDHLRELFLDAPYTAAQKIFDAVLMEDANFLVLAGDVLHPQATGPRGPLFLLEQFARLAERGIGVYWAGGVIDPPDSWPAALELPKNVHVFPYGRVEELTISRDGEPIARLLGVGRDRQRGLRPGDFSPDPAGFYTIAIAHGDADLAAMQTRAIDCWALGGRHNRGTPSSGSQIVHYCGSPQGRQPEETGVHGCTLIQVDQERQTRTSLIPTEAVRWLAERIVVDDTTTHEELESRLRERMHAVVDAAPTTALLISWTIAGRGPLLGELRGGTLGSQLLEGLRSEFGHRTPPAWSIAIESELSETLPPEWYEQETIRGDFLRAVRQLQMNADEPIGLESYLAETHLAGTLAAAASLVEAAARERVLREAAALGVELLSGEDRQA
jgi:DNA repair protein SbcD/Mre11